MSDLLTSDVSTADLLTIRQAAEHLGVAVGTLKRRIASGILAPAQRGGRSKTNPHLYRLSDIEALRSTIGHHRTPEQEAWLQSGKRPCATCGEVKPFEEFDRHRLGLAGRNSQCKVCRSARFKERWADPEFHAKRMAAYMDWERRNPEKKRASRRRYVLKHREAFRRKSGPYWHTVEKVRPEMQRRKRERQAFYRAIHEVLDFGKSRPFTKRGFSIVRCPDGSYRAARLDRPLPTGEVALARYEYSDTARRWIVFAPSVKVGAYQKESERVVAYCRQREAMGQREGKVATR